MYIFIKKNTVRQYMKTNMTNLYQLVRDIYITSGQGHENLHHRKCVI